jgi:hypothetical protein
MRIETFNATATMPENNWVFEAMTTTDGLSHLQGLAEIDVAVDKIVPLPPLQGWTGELFAHRIIRGTVSQRLFMWEKRSEYFGCEQFLGGIHLPEEDKVYQTAEVTYDAKSNMMEITLLERHYDLRVFDDPPASGSDVPNP